MMSAPKLPTPILEVELTKFFHVNVKNRKGKVSRLVVFILTKLYFREKAHVKCTECLLRFTHHSIV